MNFNLEVFFIYMRRILKKKHIERKKTRQEKRNYKVLYKGREMTAMNYIAEVSEDLPKFIDKMTGRYLNHALVMRKLYMRNGNLQDINIYRGRILSAAKKQIKSQKK